MSNSAEQPWSEGPNSPQIPSWLYLAEKEAFAGLLTGTILYGIAVALFFQCLGVLLGSANPIGRATKWALVVHTAAMFLFLTTTFGVDICYEFICYINNREFPGSDEYPPGPIGYDYTLDAKVATTVLYVMFPLNQWLADGLLLHRCYGIYFRKHWVMAFPCLMYLASVGTCSKPTQTNGNVLSKIADVATGISYLYQESRAEAYNPALANYGISYFSISLSLNVLLTLMIVTKLILHKRNLRKALGAHSSSGVYTDLAAMLIESYALYAVAFLIYTVPWAVDSWVTPLFSKVLPSIQVIAPYLIVLRVANRRSLTRDTISGTVDSIHFRTQVSTDSDGTLLSGHPLNSMEVNGEAPGGLGAGAEVAIEEVPL